jgi:glycosyltransferase involved in cell wall biosynthesis
MSPAVSVVMAAKNYARFLPQAVDSVFAQTFADWELVIVDDGSTDDTEAAVRRYLHDRRVRDVKSDRLGQSRAKNLGIALARGEFIAFLDADDAWLPTKLEKQLSRFAGDIGVVFTRRSLIDEAGRPLPQRTAEPPPTGRVREQMFVQNFVCFSSAMVRREVFTRAGRFDPALDLAIDYDLWLRVARHYSFDFVDEELVLYRTGHGNLSKKLADRVDTVLSIMHGAESRGEAVPADLRAAAYASTYRTIGYVMRASEPRTALKWYGKALAWSDQRRVSLRGWVASALAMVRGRREAGPKENAAENR